jgi:hypothetical protein
MSNKSRARRIASMTVPLDIDHMLVERPSRMRRDRATVIA